MSKLLIVTLLFLLLTPILIVVGALKKFQFDGHIVRKKTLVYLLSAAACLVLLVFKKMGMAVYILFWQPSGMEIGEVAVFFSYIEPVLLYMPLLLLAVGLNALGTDLIQSAKVET
jgi:hypothetical protein